MNEKNIESVVARRFSRRQMGRIAILFAGASLPLEIATAQDAEQQLGAGAEADTAQTKNLGDIRAFFTSTRARAALESVNIDHQQVDDAVAALSPDGIVRTAELTRQIQKGRLVSTLELRAAIAVAGQKQATNLADVRAFFASDRVRAALKPTRVDYQRIEKAVSVLSPEDLALVAARTNQIREDFAAGQSQSNDDWVYWVLGCILVVVLLILLICLGKKNPNACSDNAG